MAADRAVPQNSAVPRGAILLVIDELMTLSRVEMAARHLGYEVRAARTIEEFWQGVAAEPILILLGTHVTRLPWRDLMRELQGRKVRPPVLAFGSHLDAATRAEALGAGAARWVANSQLTTQAASIFAAMIQQGEPGDVKA